MLTVDEGGTCPMGKYTEKVLKSIYLYFETKIFVSTTFNYAKFNPVAVIKALCGHLVGLSITPT
jgi:hypothetical protein